MVDRTLEAFGMQPNIDDTDLYNRPVTAAREDTLVRQNEDGSATYMDFRGREYTVRPTQPVPRPEGGVARAALEASRNAPGIAETVFSRAPAAAMRAVEAIPDVARAAPEAFRTFFERPFGPAAILSGERPATMGLTADMAGTAVMGPLVGAAGRTARAAATPTPAPAETPARTLAQQTEEALPAPTPVAEPVTTPAPQPTPKTAAKTEVPRYRDTAAARTEEVAPADLKGESLRISRLEIGEHDDFRDLRSVVGTGDDMYMPYGYAGNITVDDLARVAAGRRSLEDVIDSYGTDPTPEIVSRLSDAIKTLEQTPPFNFIKAKYVAPVTFRSPAVEVLKQIDVPSKGIKGSQFIKELKANPTVRTTHVNSIESNINPQQRYTREELSQLVDTRQEVRTFSGSQAQYPTYQRQRDLAHPETDYFELTINYDGPQGTAPLVPNTKHFDDNTLAHIRASVRTDEAGQPYILAEEWQSDLLQGGHAKPTTVSRQQQNEYLTQRKNQLETRRTQTQAEDNDLSFLDDIINLDGDYLQTNRTILNAVDALGAEEIANIRSAMPRNYSSELRGFYNSKLRADTFEALRRVDPELTRDVTPDILDRVTEIVSSMPVSQPAGVPPISKTEEAVRLAMDALIGEAAKRGISRIVLTPFDKILEARAPDLAAFYSQKLSRRVTPTEAIEMARQPKSGLYDTYVRATDRVVKDLGNDVIITERQLPFSNNQFVDDPAVTNLFRQVAGYTDGTMEDAVDVAGEVLRNVRRGTASEGDRNALIRFVTYLEDTIPEFVATGAVMEDVSSFNAAIRPLLAPTNMSAIEIDISPLLQQGLDLTRPRFNEGGVVAPVDAQMQDILPQATPAQPATTSPARAAHKAWMQKTMRNLTANTRRLQ
jgi:hypothetical protein